VLPAAAAALERGEPAALVTIVRASGSTPQRTGAKMLVYADGRTVGTIGGGCYEADALGRAREAIASGKPALVKYDLNDDFVEESGLICGGQMEVYIDPIAPSPALYVVGAGHVGFHLARAASDAGFRIHIVDDREKFANRDRFPSADSIVVDDIPAWLQQAEIPDSAYVVIVTRGHTHDFDALRALASRKLKYLGLIGSRAKVARIYDAMRSDGVADDALNRVHAPIGLDIGAVTPAEIAIAILAELIAVRHDKDVTAVSMKWQRPPR
jgi:xanthine dehydrogenase accessory factor